VLTVNDRVVLSRRRWYGPGLGSCTPVDALLDAAEASVSLGVRELACRLNQGSRSFAKAADNLARAAQVAMSDELLRQVVEAEGQAVLAAQQAGALTISWTAADCTAPDEQGAATEQARVYLGADGVKVPMVTAAEKQARRKRSRGGGGGAAGNAGRCPRPGRGWTSATRSSRSSPTMTRPRSTGTSP
jgi:hypothetical protein